MAKLDEGSVILGIPKILSRFQKQYSKVQVEIIEENSMELENMLVAGSLDIAIIALPLTCPTHKVEFFKRDEIFLVTNKNYPVMEFVHKRKAPP